LAKKDAKTYGCSAQANKADSAKSGADVAALAVADVAKTGAGVSSVVAYLAKAGADIADS